MRALEALRWRSQAAISASKLLAGCDAPVQALATYHADLDFDHVQPAGVLGNVVEFQPAQHPPALGKIPPHGSDAGSYLVAEAFGAHSIILLKDVDGLCTADPKTHPDAAFIPRISAAELMGMRLPTLPIEPIVLELFARTTFVRSIRLVSGLVPRNPTRARAGEQVGTEIHT